MKEKKVEKLIYDTLGCEKPPRRVLSLAEKEMDNSNNTKQSTFIARPKTWYAVAYSLATAVVTIAITISFLINSIIADGAIVSQEKSWAFYLAIALGLLGVIFLVALIVIMLKLHKHRHRK